MPLRIASPDDRDQSSQDTLLNQGWRPGRRSASRGRSPAYTHNEPVSTRDELIRTGIHLYEKTWSTVQRMTVWQRALAAVGLVILVVLGILFFVFNEKIFHALLPAAEKWKHTTGGWVILWSLVFLAAFPPVIGYSTLSTMCGFVYGVGEGWLILATATVVGSTCSLIASRTVLRKYVERMVANDKRFTALSLTLKHDGLKLLCMIRLCPLPYSISNGAMSTFPTVEPSMYALATAIITPKLLIHAFIGSRLAAIARTGEKMSAGTRAVNYLSIGGGIALGAFTGWFIYRKTMARARELEAQEVQNIRASANGRAGHAPQFSDDPEAQAGATVARDDDAVDWFDDTPSPKPETYEYSDQRSEDSFFADGDGDGNNRSRR